LSYVGRKYQQIKCTNKRHQNTKLWDQSANFFYILLKQICIQHITPKQVIVLKHQIYELSSNFIPPIIKIIIIIIIIIILNISFTQGIYTYIPETNHVPREQCVATILM
jgi:hypothetical protein